MHPFRLSRAAAIVGLALLTAACGEQAQHAAERLAGETRQRIAEATAPGGTVDTALAEARRKLHEENLKLESKSLAAKAELTPQGDLLISGTAVPFTPEQREAALAYRAGVIAIADTGLTMGQQGAALGGEAAALAIESLLKGDPNGATARIEDEAQKIKAAALVLCKDVERLEPVKERFAALVPEFQPYAEAIDFNANCDEALKAEEPAATTPTLST